MPEYDVPAMMHQRFYLPLKKAGWTAGGTHQGEEWISPDREFEVQFSHTQSILTVKYRRFQERLPDEATSEFYARRNRARWNQFSREYGHTESSIATWAMTTLMAISDWCQQMGPANPEPGCPCAEEATEPGAAVVA